MKRNKTLVISMFIFILIGLVSAATWYEITDPLTNESLQQVNYQDIGQKEYVLELSNEGYNKIDILSVTINGDDTPDSVQLGVTYDSTAIVQVLPNPDPAIKFLDVHASSIYPKLSQKEYNAALEKKYKRLCNMDYASVMKNGRFKM